MQVITNTEAFLQYRIDIFLQKQQRATELWWKYINIPKP